jgi:TonB family protein
MIRSALRPEPVKLGVALPASIGLHAALFALILSWELIAPQEATLIDPDDVMEVTMVALPKQETELAQKEMRAAAPPPPPAPDELAEPAEEPPEKPPPEERRPEPDREQPRTDNTTARADLLKQLRKQEALKNLSADAPEGPLDQARTDPDGVEGAVGSGQASVGDPELAAYVEKIRQTLMANFAPIQTDPLTTWIDVQIDASGNIVDWKVRTKSGNASFDSAALRAVMKARKVPPPPEKFKSVAEDGLAVRFSTQ